MRDGMNDGSPPTDPTPDHPEHEPWARDPGALRGFDQTLELPGMPEISSDFVARTWARIQADRRQIDAEAAQVETAPLPAELLQAYATPEPSGDFVVRTLDRLRERRSTDHADASLRDALDSFGPPPGTGDLVERTLAALRLERTRLRIVTDPPDDAVTASRAGPWRRLALAAAILVAVSFGATLLLRGLRGDGADRSGSAGREPADMVVHVPFPAAIPPTAEDYSPAPIGTAVARSSETGHVGARLGQGDGLLLFAALDAASAGVGGPR